jgi:hypothetical protein
MKKRFSIFFVLCSITPFAAAFADTASSFQVEDSSSRWSAGAGVIGLGEDFGAGINVTTPSFSSWNLATSLTASTLESSLSNSRYEDFSLGLMSRQVLSGQIHVYEKFGIGVILPTSALSSEIAMNLVTSVGIEFFPKSWNDSFIGKGKSFFGEFGVSKNTINRTANALPGNPTYASGTFTNIGLKIYL